MMRTMRASAKWIMGVVAVLFVGWMIYGYGMDIVGRGAAAPNVLAKVNGRTIDAQTFYQAVRSEQERRRAQNAPIPTTMEDQQQLEDAVLEQLIQNIVIQDELRRRGITITDQEVIEAARTSPPPEVLELPQFQTDGQFDLQKYQRFVASSADRGFLLALEARYRDELPRVKLYEQLVTGVYVSDAQLWQQYRDRNDSVTIAVLQLNPQSAAPDSAGRVTDAEVAAYYDSHRDEFRQPATAHLSFIAVSRRPTASDSAAALERARAVRQEILDGADFADVAARESADSVSRANGGDLGETPRGAFVPAFESAALALRPGQISEPVQTQFGWHVIRLESRTDSSFRARHVLIPIEPYGEHLARVEAQADTLDLFAAEQEDPAALDRVADRLGVPVAQAPALLEGTRLQLGRFLIGDAGVWAFGGAQPGELSPVVETEWAYYVFRLDSLQPEGIPPLDRVRDQVQRLTVVAKQREALKGIGAEIAALIHGGTSLEAIAEQRGLAVRTLGPFTRHTPPPALQGNPEVAGAAFGLRVGETGGPIATPFATFFLRPIRKTVADSATFVAQREPLRAQAIRQARQERIQLVLTSLREAAKVDDRRKALIEAQRKAARQQGGVPAGF
jgi:peptidyl-prolyl cis-trans isomerase D